MNTFTSRLTAGLGLLLFFAAAAVWAQSQTATTPNLALSNVLNSDGTVSLKVRMSGEDGAIQSVSGGTQYAEDALHVSGNTGTLALGVRRDTAASSTATDGDNATFNFDSTGRLWVTPSTSSEVVEDAGETAGGSGPMVMSIRRDVLASSAGTTGDNATFNTSLDGALYTTPVASVSGGASSLKRTSAGSTEDEHEVKATAGTLYSVTLTNTNAAVRYFRCANATAANTAPGTTTPIIDLAIPGAPTGAGFTSTFPVGAAFSTALTCWFVTGAADTDVAEVAANEIKAFYTFK